MTTITEPDVSLLITIKNTKPIALDDFAKSLTAWESRFEAYLQNTPDAIETRHAKLYVKEVRPGSTVIELVQMALIGGIPFLENINAVFGFAEFMKDVIVDRLLKGDPETRSVNFDNHDLKDIDMIVQPIAMDNGSNIVVNTVIKGDVHNHFTLNYTDANAVQNIARAWGSIPQAQTPSEVIHKKVLLSWKQMNASPKNSSTNFAYIEEIARGARNVVFEDESIKTTMVHNDPFNRFFVVDAQPMLSQGKVVAFKILAFYESFEKPID